MTARRDTDHLIRTYLEDGPAELPDYSYDAVRAQIDHTRQRVVFGPWREPDMSKFVALATAAAAVLVVAAVVGLNQLPRQGSIGGPGPTPSTAPTHTPGPIASPRPTASPSPTPSPSTSPGARVLPITGQPAPGTYYIDDRRITNVDRLTLTLPAGWITSESFLIKDRGEPGEVRLDTWVVTHIFSDACEWDGTLIDAGTTVDELVSALANQQGREASAASDTTLAGFPAKRIELTVPSDLDVSTCSSGFLRYWPDPGPDLTGGLCCNPAGNTDDVYVVDVTGNRLVVVTRHYPDSPAENRAELQSILDSIQIEP